MLITYLLLNYIDFLATYVALGPTLITISLGIADGYSAILLPQLAKEERIPLSVAMESWIASMAALPRPIACVFGGIFMEVIGRKNIHMACCILCLLGWIVLYFAWEYYSILVGRSVTGFCVGLLGPPTAVYLAEISEPKFRGFLLPSTCFAITFGIFLSHLLGTYVHWRTVALISCFFPVVSFVVMLFAPESPTFLAKKGKPDSAKEAFHWCRGKSMAAENELAILLQRQNQLTEKNIINFRNYNRPEFLKPLVLMLVFCFTAQWGGMNAISFYSVHILRMSLIGGIGIDEYFCMMALDVIRVVSSILACFLAKVLGRRPLAMLCCTGIVISLLVLCSSLHLLKNYPDLLGNMHVVILSAFISYIGFLNIGLIPLPWTMAGEMFPLASRGVGTGIASLVNYAFVYSAVKTTPLVFNSCGEDGAFLLYACMTSFGLIVLVLFLPETKDKPLHVIEDRLKGTKNV